MAGWTQSGTDLLSVGVQPLSYRLRYRRRLPGSSAAGAGGLRLRGSFPKRPPLALDAPLRETKTR